MSPTSSVEHFSHSFISSLREISAMAAPPPLMRLRDWEWCPLSSKDLVDPGDRFIPTRSLMNLHHSRFWLTKRRAKAPSPSEHLPAGMSARVCSCFLLLFLFQFCLLLAILCDWSIIGRIQEEGDGEFDVGARRKAVQDVGFQRESKTEQAKNTSRQPDESGTREPSSSPPPDPKDRVLDAAKLLDDYYLNLIDWGKSNILAVALGPSLYLWNAKNNAAQVLIRTDGEDHPTSVAWSRDGKTLGVGFASSKIELWDAIALKQVRTLMGHMDRVGSLSWNQNVLTSGSRDKNIINHDVRLSYDSASQFRGHSEEVCGLRWSEAGDMLASGGNDNLVHVWESGSWSRYLHRFTDHRAAVRALAWCPFEPKTLASGGGTADKCVKIWSINTGKCTKSIDTRAQVCALEWNRHQKEIVSAHGYRQNQLSLWSYPSMFKITDLLGHTGRVLHLSQSPDGSTLISAAADETLRFWKLFQLTKHSSLSIEYDGLLSATRMHIR